MPTQNPEVFFTLFFVGFGMTIGALWRIANILVQIRNELRSKNKM